jgi:DNA-binding LytR/AlgR family response regulator
LGYEVMGICYSYTEAERALQQLAVDVVLLDINLRDSDFRNNGLRLAGKVPTGTPFIFLTGYSDLNMIREATQLRPYAYLIKPATAATLFAALQTTFELTRSPLAVVEKQPVGVTDSHPDFFFVKVGADRRKIFWKDIAYIAAGKNYVKLCSALTKEEYPIRGTLTFVLEQLLPQSLKNTFVRINRAVSVNRFWVTAYNLLEVACAGQTFENTRLMLRDMHSFFGNDAYAAPATVDA